jgi:hypothetical protein
MPLWGTIPADYIPTAWKKQAVRNFATGGNGHFPVCRLTAVEGYRKRMGVTED